MKLDVVAHSYSGSGTGSGVGNDFPRRGLLTTALHLVVLLAKASDLTRRRCVRKIPRERWLVVQNMIRQISQYARFLFSDL